MPPSNTPRTAGHRPIVLIGPMAVGKSALGHQLAQQLGAPFVDTDSVIVENHGSIADIFAGRGEHAFREIEAPHEGPQRRMASLPLPSASIQRTDSGAARRLARPDRALSRRLRAG